MNFPILYATEGGGDKGKPAISKVTLDNASFEYKYPVMGKPKKTSIVVRSAYVTGDKPGLAGTPFKVVFGDRWFFRQQMLYPPLSNAPQLQVRVMEDPKAVGDGFEYILQLAETSMTLFMPPSALQSGQVWSGGVAKVPYKSSKGTESRSQLPSAATNMLSLTRTSYNFQGNVGKKIMMFEIPVDGKVFKTYMDWELYLNKLQFMEQCETDLWWSRYGKSSTGDFYLTDNETSVPITSGAGIDQQIPPSNSDTYSFLTIAKFENIVRDVTFNITDDLAEIHIYTGRGGMQDFDKAAKTALKGFTQFIDSRQFSSGENSHDLVLGAYFIGFRYVDGQTVYMHYHPMFDRGIRAENAPKHPISGLPITSHDFYFIDQTSYEGVSNLRYVVESGREYLNFVVAGAHIPVGYPETQYRATDRDETSIETIKSQGIQIMRPSSCFKLLCTAA